MSADPSRRAQRRLPRYRDVATGREAVAVVSGRPTDGARLVRRWAGTMRANKTLITAAVGCMLALAGCQPSAGSGPTTITTPVNAAGDTPTPPADTSTTTPAADGSSQGAVSTTPPAPSTPAADKTTTVDICKALPPAKVAGITGIPFTTGKSDAIMGQVFSCTYEDSPKLDQLVIAVDIKIGQLGMDGDLQSMSGVAGSAIHKLTGYGDAAFTVDDRAHGGSEGAALFACFGAVFGTDYFKISNGYVAPDKAKKLIDQLRSAMS